MKADWKVMGLIHIFKYQNLFTQIGVVFPRSYPGVLDLIQMSAQSSFGMPLSEMTSGIVYRPHKRLHRHRLQYFFSSLRTNMGVLLETKAAQTEGFTQSYECRGQSSTFA